MLVVLTADLSLPSSTFPLFLSLSAWLDETITTGCYQLSLLTTVDAYA